MKRSVLIKVVAILSFAVFCMAAIGVELELKFSFESFPGGSGRAYEAAQTIRKLQSVQMITAAVSIMLIFISLYRPTSSAS